MPTRQNPPTLPTFRATSRFARLALVSLAIVLIAVSAGGAITNLSKGDIRDFSQFYWAARAMREGADLYSGASGGYLYPPLLAFALIPLTVMSAVGAATAWLVFNVALLMTSAWLAAQEAVKAAGLRSSNWVTLGLAVGGTLVVADKARSCLSQGQTDLLMVFAFVLGLRWMRHRAGATGCLAAAATMVKYASVVVLPYLLIRRRWRAAAWMGLWVVVLALLPSIHRGWDRNLEDLRTAMGKLSQIAGTHGDWQSALTVRHRSNSIPTAVSWWVMGRGETAGASASHQSRQTISLIVMLIGLALVGVAAVIYRSRGVPFLGRHDDGQGQGVLSEDRARRVMAIEWSGLIVMALAFSPHTEGRHMVLLLPVVCLMLALCAGERSTSGRVVLAAGVGVLWLALVLPPGGERFRSAVEAWRAAAGPSWCMVLAYFGAMWVGLRREPCLVKRPAGPAGCVAAAQ